MKLFLNILIAFLLSCNLANAKPVQPIYSGDLSELFQLNVINHGLKKMGYKIAPAMQAQVALIFLAMTTGNVDYFPAYWDPMSSQNYKRFAPTNTLAVRGLLLKGTKQGVLISKKISEKYNIHTYADLKNNKHLFAQHHSNKAILTGCEQGWVCSDYLESLLKHYDLEEDYHLNSGGYGALLSNVIADYFDDKPVLYYAWEPHWIHQYLKPGQDVVWLEESNKDLKKIFPSNDLRILANKQFLADHPDIEAFFEKIRFSFEDINQLQALLHQYGNKKSVVKTYSDAWIAAHEKEIDGWLGLKP